MKINRAVWIILAGAVLASGAAFTQEPVPVIPTDSGEGVKKVLYARTIQLEEPYRYEWTGEKPRITTGTLLVLEVEPELARIRQVNMPVLYVGTVPAEVTNDGSKAGRMIVIVPGEVDLKRALIYFGSVELPERVDADRGRAELEAARSLGIRPLSATVVEAARKEGGDPLRVKDSVQLYRAVSDLLEKYSPSETGRIKTYRMKTL